MIFFTFTIPLFSQEEIPREFEPEEFISMNRDIKMSTALEIINQFTTKYEKKLIIDSKEHKKPIGVVVDNMHWKRALEYILRSNMLKYIEHPRHYEIIETSQKQETPADKAQLSIKTQEIEIKALFFEADLDAMTEMGIDWSTLANGKVKLNVASQGATAVSENFFSVGGYYGNGVWDVFTLLSAMESRSKGRVIATPQVRILEGEEGKIKVGKNFFLTTRDFAGNTRFTEYESGVILTVIPKIIKQGKLSMIHLMIHAEKSDVIPSVVNAIKKITEGKTQVLLLDSEETAIAGLISNETTSLRKGVPILKDLPWWFFGVRYLFGYNSVHTVQKELVIIIKAEIVPSILTRVKAKINMQNYLKERREILEKRIKELGEN